MEIKGSATDPNQILPDNHVKWFIEMLSIKEDANMTRVYSALSKPDLNNYSTHSIKTEMDGYNA